MSRYFTIEDVAALENLSLAAKKARKRKSRRPDVETFHLREESRVLELREQLLAGTWMPGGYRLFEIHEPKRRRIAAAPYRDRVVHHALCNLLCPVLDRRFIARSFSCRFGKGTAAARECCRLLVNRHRFVLKCDVRKFFDSLDHGVLREKLWRSVHCPGVRQLMHRILDSYHTAPGKGVPIGNLTSQWWGNLYLDALDHWMTCERSHGAYLRYTDDFLIFGDDAGTLRELLAGVKEQLDNVSLTLAEPKSRLLACREGVPFCGFRFFPEERPRILGATKRRFEARRQALRRQQDFRRLRLATFSWYQFSREGNTSGLRAGYARKKRRGFAMAKPPG